MAGYKHVYKNRFFIEVGMAYDVNIANLVLNKNDSSFEVNGTINVKLGYRFSAAPEPESLNN